MTTNPRIDRIDAIDLVNPPDSANHTDSVSYLGERDQSISKAGASAGGGQDARDPGASPRVLPGCVLWYTMGAACQPVPSPEEEQR